MKVDYTIMGFTDFSMNPIYKSAIQTTCIAGLILTNA